MKKLIVKTSVEYPVYIGEHLINSKEFTDCCQAIKKRPVIITDSHLAEPHGKNLQLKLIQHGLAAELISFPAGEIHKTRETKQILEDKLLTKQYGRDTFLLALGGGVVTDLAGFLGATWCRGIPVIYIPTSLLAMTDASIGGKTGVNTFAGKNLIGTITQPHAVFMDTDYLCTLPDVEFANGMAEIIKHAAIADKKLFDLLRQKADKIKQRDPRLLAEIIYASCLVKKNIIEQDEKDHGIRQLLNFGHTIGHAIETLKNYGIRHGEAVAIGMLAECYLATRCGYLHENIVHELRDVLKKYDLPLKTMAFHDRDALREALKSDKKSLENIAQFVLLKKIAEPVCESGKYVKPVQPEILDQTLAWATEFFDK